MDLMIDIVLLILGFVLGFVANWYFYRKQRKENEANTEVLKQIRQYIGAQIRLGNDKSGKIVQRKDGTIAIDWTLEFTEKVGVNATHKVEVEKRSEKSRHV